MHKFSGQSAAEHVRIKQTHLANEYDRVVVTTATGLVFNLEVRDGNGALYGLLESDSVDGHGLRFSAGRGQKEPVLVQASARMVKSDGNSSEPCFEKMYVRLYFVVLSGTS